MDRRKFLAALAAPVLPKLTAEKCALRCTAVDPATNTIELIGQRDYRIPFHVKNLTGIHYYADIPATMPYGGIRRTGGG